MNTRYVARSGFCPTLNKPYNVSVEQIETTTLEDSYRKYMDDTFTCEYASQHDCPLAENCPVAKITR